MTSWPGDARRAEPAAAADVAPARRTVYPSSMQVKLLFFAIYRELAGAEEMTLELPAGSTARDAVRALRASGGGLARLPQEPVVAVNREYAGEDAALRDGDELALLPPVAGG